MKKGFLCLFLILILSSCNSDLVPVEGIGPVGTASYPIINGTPVTASDYDYVVGLHRVTKKYGGGVYVLPFCTGTLITPSVVLTAAHCLDKSEDFAPVEPLKASELNVYFGNSPGSTGEDGSYDVSNGAESVEEVLIHSDYDKFNLTNDIGLIRLRGTAPVLPTAALSEPDGFTPVDVGSLTLTLVGFGEDENGDYGVKLTADVTLSGVSETLIEHDHAPEGICFGDSGGPALVSRDSGVYVGGVASYVTYPYCASSGAHTRVDAYSEWINDFVNFTSEPPVDTCEDLLPLGELCFVDAECCSGKCKGPTGRKSCK